MQTQVTMVNVTSNFTSGLKKVMMNRYTRGPRTSSALRYNFNLSEEESSGEEVDGINTYLDNQVVGPDPLQL